MEKLTLKTKLGYSIAACSDAISYTFVGSFFLFFLTTVAGIRPATAGVLIAIGSIYNALFNPLLGVLSDRVRTRFGRRRPLILASAAPLGLTLFLLYTNIPLPGLFKPIYYGLMLMLFWTCYVCFFVPYGALGVDYTADYNQRTLLRLFGSAFNSLGSLISMMSPTLLVSVFTGFGLPSSTAWSITGGIMGLLSALLIFITGLASKRHDPPREPLPKEERQPFRITEIFTEYLSILKLKPMAPLILVSVACLCLYTMTASDTVYTLTYVLGMSGSQISLVMAARVICNCMMLPLWAKVTLWLDKKYTLMLFLGLGAFLFLFLRLVGISSLPLLVVYIIALSFSSGLYWSIVPSMYYDICDYDYLENRVHREGAVCSFQGLVEALAAAASTLILGTILDAVGFNGDMATQTPLVQEWIFNCTTLVPIVFIVVAIVALRHYPLTRAAHHQLLTEIAKREAQEEAARKTS